MHSRMLGDQLEAIVTALVMTNTDRSSSGVSVDIFILPQSFRFHETRMYGNNLLFQLLSRIISGCIPERLEEQKIYPKLDKKRCR